MDSKIIINIKSSKQKRVLKSQKQTTLHLVLLPCPFGPFESGCATGAGKTFDMSQLARVKHTCTVLWLSNIYPEKLKLIACTFQRVIFSKFHL